MINRMFRAVVCICVVIITAGIPAAASASHERVVVQPLWTNTEQITLTMSYFSGAVNWTGEIRGKSGTASIEATYRLYRKNPNGTYTLIESWPDLSTTGITLFSFGSKTALQGTYKLTVTGTVTSDAGVVEYISDSLEKTLT